MTRKRSPEAFAAVGGAAIASIVSGCTIAVLVERWMVFVLRAGLTAISPASLVYQLQSGSQRLAIAMLIGALGGMIVFAVAGLVLLIVSALRRGKGGEDRDSFPSSLRSDAGP